MVMSILSYINERKNPPLCSNLISRYRQNGDKIRLGFDDIQIYFVKIYIKPGNIYTLCFTRRHHTFTILVL